MRIQSHALSFLCAPAAPTPLGETKADGCAEVHEEKQPINRGSVRISGDWHQLVAAVQCNEVARIVKTLRTRRWRFSHAHCFPESVHNSLFARDRSTGVISRVLERFLNWLSGCAGGTRFILVVSRQ